MENKHTPLKEGEWIVEGRFIYILHNPDGRHLRNKFSAHVTPDLTPDWFGKVSNQEAEKVACVFGAAYDMLEALKSITLSMRAHPDCTEGSEFADMVSIAEKAIKKAQPHE